MNAKQLFAVSVFALASSGAFAAYEDSFRLNTQAPSVLSRAEVRAELLKARAEGTLPQRGDIDFTAFAAPVRTLPAMARDVAAVRAEARIAAMTRNDASFRFMQ